MFKLPPFIESCRATLRERGPALAVRKILSDTVKDAGGIEAALGTAAPKMGESAQYVFLHQAPDLTILKVVMPARLLSPPHNHLIWAVIGLYRGCENNVFYRREDTRIVESSRRNLIAPEVMVLPPDIIHSIANPLDEPSCALHVYGGMLANPARSLWNPVTLEEEPFQIPQLLKYERELQQRFVG